MGSPSGANILVPIAFLSWFPLVVAMYKRFEKRLVPVIAYVAGWMFLPVANYDIFLLKNTKTTVTGLAILAGAWMFDRERLKSFRYNIADLPMVLWCIAPFFSSLFNDLGPYDGLSQTMYQTIRWGLPYYIGRVCFTDNEVLKSLALTIFIGAIIYIPFCLFELKMSPQLHRLTYGFHQHDFLQTLRDNGGYRPMVYMDHGLMTSMWMMLASLLGTWMFFTRSLPEKVLGMPSVYPLLALVATTIMMQSVAAICYYFIAIAVLYLTSRMKKTFLVAILLILPHLYVLARTGGSWDGRNFSEWVAVKFSPTRAQSVQFRFDNETVLIDKAKQGSFFGWAGYGRSRVFNDDGKDLTVTDGLWIIAYGVNGTYGLSTLMIMIQLPVLLFMRRTRPGTWMTPEMAAPAAMAVFLGFTMVDNLLNAMINPIYMLFSGGLIGMVMKTDPVLTAIRQIVREPAGAGVPEGTRFIGGSGVVVSRFI
jgi:hypothetical protein